jgi:hypothetical protein
MRSWQVVIPFGALVVALMPGLVRADTFMGASSAALPGVHRVAAADPGAAGAALFVGAGYGMDRAVLAAADEHHRLAGSLAASLRALPWLALALRLDGRYDRHTGLADGVDEGMVGDPRLVIRAGRALGRDWQAGAQLMVWVPGSQAPSVVLGATTVDALALVGYAPAGSGLRILLNAGVRVDRSAASARDAYLLSQADRMSLGVSESHAALVGVGAGYRLGRVELIGEWTWDVLVGERAPAREIWPMRLAGGARIDVRDVWSVQIMAESRLSAPPDGAYEQPLAPFVPRLSVAAGLSYRFGARSSAPDRSEVPVHEPPETVLEGRVLSREGVAIVGAKVTVEAGDHSLDDTTDADGRFRVAGVPAGQVRVRVTAEGYEEHSALADGAPGELSVTLETALPSGQLRGLVRSFRGQPVTATLAIEPGGMTVTTDDKGWFETDVPPGHYEVTVRAQGYREQRRSVTVEQGGVTIINVDLRAE